MLKNPKRHLVVYKGLKVSDTDTCECDLLLFFFVMKWVEKTGKHQDFTVTNEMIVLSPRSFEIILLISLRFITCL
jgi:hypothetical protein